MLQVNLKNNMENKDVYLFKLVDDRISRLNQNVVKEIHKHSFENASQIVMKIK
jgi:tRNA 2-selenouridine synthase SelU